MVKVVVVARGPWSVGSHRHSRGACRCVVLGLLWGRCRRHGWVVSVRCGGFGRWIDGHGVTVAVVRGRGEAWWKAFFVAWAMPGRCAGVVGGVFSVVYLRSHYRVFWAESSRQFREVGGAGCWVRGLQGPWRGCVVCVFVKWCVLFIELPRLMGERKSRVYVAGFAGLFLMF